MSRLKIIRDPVYDYISLDIPRDQWLLDLINAREVQRLRHIHQLGASYFVYPGATHARFSHTLGVLHLMKLTLRHLQEHQRIPRRGSVCKALLAAAVVHDIGHAPFSHVLESQFGEGHEDWSCRILKHSRTDIHRVLHRAGIVDKVVSLLRKEEGERDYWQRALISSQLDVDRMDYLLRDSHFAGVGYGKFDYYRLIHTMTLDYPPEVMPGQTKPVRRPVWPDKTKYAAEEYIFARYYMYQSVYFHHCTRGYEKLLEAIWERATNLVQDGCKLPAFAAIDPFLAKKKPSVQNFLRLTDYVILAQVAAWQDDKATKDKVLSDLSRRFVMRKGFKCIETKGRLEGLREGYDRFERALAYLKARGGNVGAAPRCYLLDDKAGIVVYKPYKWGEKEEPDPILLREGGKIMEISNVVKRLQPLTEKEEFVRYYCPQEHKKKLQKILSP